MVDPVCWFQLTRSQKEVNELPGLAEDKETEKKGYNKIHNEKQLQFFSCFIKKFSHIFAKKHEFMTCFCKNN